MSFAIPLLLLRAILGDALVNESARSPDFSASPLTFDTFIVSTVSSICIVSNCKSAAFSDKAQTILR